MYCKKCGKSIPDEEKFCKYCGTKINNPAIINNDINENALVQKKTVIESSNQTKDNQNYDENSIYKRAVDLCIQYANDESKVMNTIREEYGIDLHNAKKIADKALSDMVSTPSKISINNPELKWEEKSRDELLQTYIKIKDKLVEVNDKKNILYRTQVDIQKYVAQEKTILSSLGFTFWIYFIIGVITIFTGLFTFGVLGLIMGIIAFCILFHYGSKYSDEFVKPENEKASEELRKKVIEPKIAEFNMIKKEIDTLWDSEELLLYEVIIPDEYKNFDAIDFFIHALKVGRADSQKEVFNLYENELHNRKLISMQREMINKQDEQIRLSREQNKKLDAINKNQEKSNAMQKKISRQVRYGNVVSTIDLLSTKKVKVK